LFFAAEVVFFLKMENIKFNYAPAKKISENLWEIRGEWRNKFGRRMTIHSATRQPIDYS
jgi:hypothetical protein